MKTYLALLLIILCSNLSGVQKKHVSSIVLYRVDIDIETAINVSPACFFSAFVGEIDTLKRSNKFICILLENINKKHILKKHNSLNTRYIIKIEYNNGLMELIYGDRFCVFYKNKYYKTSPLLLSQIKTD